MENNIIHSKSEYSEEKSFNNKLRDLSKTKCLLLREFLLTTRILKYYDNEYLMIHYLIN
jgi:hypothetical protein